MSYAVLIVTALGVVAFVLILYLLRNPVLYRQTFVQLRAADHLLNQPNSNARLYRSSVGGTRPDL